MRSVCLILMLSAGSCFAQTPVAVCPWLSTGSAAQALGGQVETDFQIESNWQGTCRFTRGSGTDRESIEITIGKVDTHACSAGSAKVVGLGNEAVECKAANPGGLALEVIAGRVRDVHFVVGITNPHRASTTTPAATHRGDPEKVPVLEVVAEQVVGSLY
ncbi:MAG TPA: hypothetical protein VMD76_02120 [Candidatus Sulfotelmatobacter sp.]|nr:hypothetical protein [Candidatus Sulfotelmatobacter sp.]